MRATRFLDPEGRVRIGRLEDSTVVDAGEGPFVPSGEAWAAIEDASGEEWPIEDVRFFAPVAPLKVIGIGLNYRDHAEESGLGIPEVPALFAIWSSALCGDGATIVVPAAETRPDYEGELAIVLGRAVKDATEDEAAAAIGGYAAFNDVSGRRAQLETPLRQFTLGKSFDTFAPLGAISPADGVDLSALAIRTTVSGEVMQESSTSNLIFGPAELVAYCSQGTTLEAGTVIATGTPAGVGDARTPPRYLVDGDVVEVSVEGAAPLRNPVAR